MTLEIRPTDNPERFDLYEEDQKIGEITEDLDIEDGVRMGPSLWCAEVWSQMGTGKTFYAESRSFEEIKQYAHEVYDEMAAERRELSKGFRIWTTGSIPMGGKPGWRRR